MSNNETFNYTYSAKEQDEIKAIRQKYMPPEESEDKLTQLRRLDAAVTKKATTVSLIVGVIGTLVMGIGMSLAMTDIGAMLGTTLSMVIGVSVGIVGIILIGLAYPVYNRIVKKNRKKIAPQIISLADELMK